MQNNNSGKIIKTLLFLFILATCCCVTVGGAIFALSRFNLNANGNPTNGSSQPDQPNTAVFNYDKTYSGPKVESIYNESIPQNPVKQVTINELRLLLDTLNLLKNTNWDGAKGTALPISSSDFDLSKLKQYVQDENSKKDKLTIPKDEEDLYISSSAASDIQQIILSARSEYLAYLRTKGVLSKYIDEMDTVVLPNDQTRIVYHAVNDPDAPPTAVSAYKGADDQSRDYRKVILDVYAVDVYNYASDVINSRILGDIPTDQTGKISYTKKARDLGARMLIYHEMTHVTQRSYATLHIPDYYIQKGKTDIIYSEKTLTTLDDKYFWPWGNSGFTAELNNQKVSNESQAEGISFEVVTNVYNMSKSQRESLWQHVYGRLKDSQDILYAIKDIFMHKYPNFAPENFYTLLSPVFDQETTNLSLDEKYTLGNIVLKMSNLPADVGYLNPMLPEDTYKFWDALKQN